MSAGFSIIGSFTSQNNSAVAKTSGKKEGGSNKNHHSTSVPASAPPAERLVSRASISLGDLVQGLKNDLSQGGTLSVYT